MSRRIDGYDRKLLALLRDNSRLDDTKSGSLIGKSGNATRLRRIKLEDAGVIERYTICISTDALLYSSYFYMLVKLVSNNKSVETRFEHYVRSKNEILSADELAGEWDYILYVGCVNSQAIDRISLEIRKMDMVDNAISLKHAGQIKPYNVDYDQVVLPQLDN